MSAARIGLTIALDVTSILGDFALVYHYLCGRTNATKKRGSYLRQTGRAQGKRPRPGSSPIIVTGRLAFHDERQVHDGFHFILPRIHEVNACIVVSAKEHNNLTVCIISHRAKVSLRR